MRRRFDSIDPRTIPTLCGPGRHLLRFAGALRYCDRDGCTYIDRKPIPALRRYGDATYG